MTDVDFTDTCTHGVTLDAESAAKILDGWEPSDVEDFILGNPASQEIRKRWHRLSGACPPRLRLRRHRVRELGPHDRGRLVMADDMIVGRMVIFHERIQTGLGFERYGDAQRIGRVLASELDSGRERQDPQFQLLVQTLAVRAASHLTWMTIDPSLETVPAGCCFFPPSEPTDEEISMGTFR